MCMMCKRRFDVHAHGNGLVRVVVVVVIVSWVPTAASMSLTCASVSVVHDRAIASPCERFVRCCIGVCSRLETRVVLQRYFRTSKCINVEQLPAGSQSSAPGSADQNSQGLLHTST